MEKRSIIDINSTLYPKQVYNKECPLNVFIRTLPENYPYYSKDIGECASIKKIYPSRPHDYPFSYRYTPVGTLYERMFPDNYASTFKAYPYTNRHTREILAFSKGYVPTPTIFRWARQEE